MVQFSDRKEDQSKNLGGIRAGAVVLTSITGMDLVVVELSSYRACSRAHSGASFTFGALAILVVATWGKTQSCLSTRSVPVTAIAVSPQVPFSLS